MSHLNSPFCQLQPVQSTSEFEAVGKGGFGVVFKAFHSGYKQEIAVKRTEISRRYINDENCSSDLEYKLKTQSREFYFHHKLTEYTKKLFSQKQQCQLELASLKLPKEKIISIYETYSKLFLKNFDLHIHHELFRDTFSTVDYEHKCVQKEVTLYNSMEYMPISLKHLRENHQDKLSCNDIKQIMHKLALGLEFLHNSSVVHRDISPDNILTDWQNQRVCITDFGQARQVEPLTHIDFCKNQCHEALTSNTKLAKIHYRPPEGISYYNAQFNSPDSKPQSYHDYSWDMWQLGMVYLYLITPKERKHPLAYLDNDYKILQGKLISVKHACAIAPDAYMAKVIEDHFGMPTRSEIRDLSFHYPIKSDTDFDFQRIIEELTSFNSDNKPYYLPKKDGRYQQLHENYFSDSLKWIRGTSFFPDMLLNYFPPSCFPDVSRIKERRFKQEFVVPSVYLKSGCKKELVKRLTHFFKLEEAFQISHKQAHYKKVMNLSDVKHIDQYRLALIRSRENSDHAHSLQFVEKDSEFISKVQEVIVSLLRFSPANRATASELLDSEFFASDSIPKSARQVMTNVLNSKKVTSELNPLTQWENFYEKMRKHL